MRLSKYLLLILLLPLVLFSCSKGNEHITRDLYTRALPINFDFPAITDSTSVITISEFKGSTNLDSLIRVSTNSQFGTEDIASIRLSSLKMDVVNSDTTYNFRLLENLSVKLSSKSTLSDELAKVNSNSDIISQTINIPVTGPDVQLKDVFNAGNYNYVLVGKIRRKTSRSFKATLTAQYRITLAK